MATNTIRSISPDSSTRGRRPGTATVLDNFTAQSKVDRTVGAQAHSHPLRPTSPSMLNRAVTTMKRGGDEDGNSQPSSSFNLQVVQGLAQEHKAGMICRSSGTPATFSTQSQPVVIFGEEDFDDDGDLDFEVENPSLLGSIPQPPEAQAQAQAESQEHRQQTAEQPASLALSGVAGADGPQSKSSAPLPWSPSPYRQSAVSTGQLPLTSHEPAVDTTRNLQPAAQEDARPPSKRRKLPWDVPSGELGTRADDEIDGTTVTDKDRAMSRKSRAAARAGQAHEPQDTPNRSGSKAQPLWDQTASAIKEKQKELKKARKKSRASADASDAAAKAGQHKAMKRVGRVFLSDEQKAVARLVVDQGKSVFFTGSAGTGKSVLLRELIKGLQSKYRHEPDRVAVTASTGLAACNIGGVTLHSYSGIGLGKDKVKELLKKIKRNGKASERWKKTQVLIIDEVSMVDGEMFDKLEELARLLRRNGKPFGGIQLVITGDFFQLPPVPDRDKPVRFTFEAATWSTTIERRICLTQVFRQKDPVFAGMLNEMRLGVLTPKSIDTFRSLSRPIKYQDDLDATELFSTRAEVDNANGSRLRQLEGTGQVYEARDGGTLTDKAQRDRLLANCMAPASLNLKKGAQVMLIKNLDESLVNGSLGKIVAFLDERELETLQHKDPEHDLLEGLAVDYTMDLGGGYGRPKPKLDGESAKVPGRKWPYVRFTNADGTVRSILCTPEMWKTELPNGEIQASRTQVPLILAWALSIHKAQGQTLERVKVDLGRIFEKGQAYVALSRATSQEGLQVLRFDPRKVMAHERVREFYDGLYRDIGVANPHAQRTPAESSTATRKPQPPSRPSLFVGDDDDDDDDEEESRGFAYG